MESNPLVTINILSFNRKNDLFNTLMKVYEQDYQNIEVIVVDNASVDGTQAMVHSSFPKVRLIELQKNIGIAGWNEGFKAAKGDYILVLDDDSYPANDTLFKTIPMIVQNKECGILTLKVFNPVLNGYETEMYSITKPLSFVGCGAIIRKNIFLKVDYFNNLLFLYEHEIEFSMRVVDAGFKIIFSQEGCIVHNLSMLNRQIILSVDHRKQFYTIRNIIIVMFLHFSIHKVFFRIFRIIAGRIFWAIKNKCLKTTLKGLMAAIKVCIKISNNREVLSKNTQKYYLYGAYAGGFHF